MDCGTKNTTLKRDEECEDIVDCEEGEEFIYEMNGGEILLNKKVNLKIFNIECYVNKLLSEKILTLHQLRNLPNAEHRSDIEDAFVLVHDNDKQVTFNNNGYRLHVYRHQSKKIPHFHVLDLFSTRILAICLKSHCTLIILLYLLISIIPLFIEEIFFPHHLRYKIFNTCNFCFCRTSRIQFLFARLGISFSSTQRHSGTCVSFHVSVCSTRSINLPFNDSQVTY